MSWFFIALCAPFLWSIVNHVDKFILSKYFKSGGAGALMIFVGVVALPLALIIFAINPSVLSISGLDMVILVASGILYNLGVLLYLYALEEEDASLVVPFWQLTPVFAYFLGVFLLGEYLTQDKILASLIVLFGALLLSIEFEEGRKFSIRKKVVFIMFVSSFFLASSYTLFKKSEVGDSSFSISLFWNQIGMLLFALFCLCVKRAREEFIDVIRQNSGKVLALNIAEQAVETLGVAINNFAVLLAPAALVILVEYTVQPLFVFVEGILLTLLFPRFIKENISKKHLTQKLVSIIIMGLGLYLIAK